MSDHPSTYEGTPNNGDETAWDDRASLHKANDGGGVLDGAKALQHGSFAEMIRRLLLMPESERSQYVIEKAGDRRYTAAEAAALATRSDFPS
jgi:hypothetical protein